MHILSTIAATVAATTFASGVLAQTMSCSEVNQEGFIPADVVRGTYRAPGIPAQPDGCQLVVHPSVGRPPENQVLPHGIITMVCPGGDHLSSRYIISDEHTGECRLEGNLLSTVTEATATTLRIDPENILAVWNTSYVDELKHQIDIDTPQEACDFIVANYLTPGEVNIDNWLVNEMIYPESGSASYRGVCVQKTYINGANVETPHSLAMTAWDRVTGAYIPPSQMVEEQTGMQLRVYTASIVANIGQDGLGGQVSAAAPVIEGVPDTGVVSDMQLERIPATDNFVD